jgi:outer membrane receptor protein involved in Fe transport
MPSVRLPIIVIFAILAGSIAAAGPPPAADAETAGPARAAETGAQDRTPSAAPPAKDEDTDGDADLDDASPRIDEEVVVRATFRDRVARDVPASVLVLDGAEVAQTAVQHFEDLSFQVPNLHFSGEGNRAKYWQIRGIGEREQYTGAPDPSVGFVIDDVDVSGIGGVATLWDVDQVEVLRGPQGTRYGSGALAGLVYARSAAPTETFEARGELTLGSDDTRALGFAAGGPLTEDGGAGYRVAVHRHESDGFRDNPYLGRDDTNGRQETTVRGKLRLRPGDAWTVDLTGFWIDVDDGYDAFALDNGRTTLSDRPGRDAQTTTAGALRATGGLSDAVTLVSITSAARSDGTFGFDADWGNPESWAPYTYDFVSNTERRRDTATQEVRLVSAPGAGLAGGRVPWLAGVYLHRLEESNRTRDRGLYVDPAFPDDPFVLDAGIARDYRATHAALFGEVTIPAGTRGEVAIGLRGERREARYRDDAGDAVDPTESMLGGQVTYLRRLGTDRRAYLRLARGYKAGGFNLALPPGAGDDRRLYGAEALWNLESGVKGRTRGGRVAYDLVAFWSERRDQQIETSIQLDPNNPASFAFVTDNAGRGRNAGVEASGSWQATAALRLQASAAYLHTEILEFEDDPRLEGRDQAHAPRFSYAAAGVWRDARGRFARLDVVGKSAFYFDDSHDRRSEPYTLVHVRVGLERKRWAAYVWGRNVFDATYATRGFFFGNEPPDFPPTTYVKRGDPAQVGITLRYAM